jgi:hypothetical protein
MEGKCLHPSDQSEYTLLVIFHSSIYWLIMLVLWPALSICRGVSWVTAVQNGKPYSDKFRGILLCSGYSPCHFWCLSIPTIRSWWSQVGSNATSGCYLQWRWLSHTLWMPLTKLWIHTCVVYVWVRSELTWHLFCNLNVSVVICAIVTCVLTWVNLLEQWFHGLLKWILNTSSTKVVKMRNWYMEGDSFIASHLSCATLMFVVLCGTW